jgi:hypothetical protein
MANKFQGTLESGNGWGTSASTRRAINAVSKDKNYCYLYWIATIKTREELPRCWSETLQHISLVALQQGGITSLLTFNKLPGKDSHIPLRERENLLENCKNHTGAPSMAQYGTVNGSNSGKLVWSQNGGESPVPSPRITKRLSQKPSRELSKP